MPMNLPCPICKALATHEVRWVGTDEFRIYCQKHAREQHEFSSLETTLRRLATD